MRSCPKRTLRIWQRAVTGKTQLERALTAEDVTEFRAYLRESEELHDEVGMFVISDFPLEVEAAATVIEKRKAEVQERLDLGERIQEKLTTTQ